MDEYQMLVSTLLGGGVFVLIIIAMIIVGVSKR